MTGIKIICQNKRARHDFFIEDTFEAGIVLKGAEVKSLRDGKANLADSHAQVDKGEVWLFNCHIDPYAPAAQFAHHPMRPRKLLLHKREIERLIGKTREKGYTLVCLKLYFKDGRAKAELGLARAKKLHDKRDTLKKRAAQREIDQAMKGRTRG